MSECRIRPCSAEKSGVECLVVNCNNRGGKDKLKGETRHYYRLPKDRILRQKWLAAIPRAKWEPKDWHRICSDHFVGGERSKSADSPAYVPSIFPGKTKLHHVRQTKTSKKASLQKKSDLPAVKRQRKKIRCHTNIHNAVWQTTDHDYLCTKRENPASVISQSDNNTLLERVHFLEEEVKFWKKRSLCLDNVKDSDEDFQFYTNFPNYAIFKAVCEYLETRSGGGLKYWRGSETTRHQHFENRKPGPQRKLSFEEEFFMVLVRSKIRCSSRDIADRFGVSPPHVSRVLSTWFNFLDNEMRFLFEMKDDDDNVAYCYKDMPDLKIIIDCTEQQCERSSNLQARKETFSNYKQRDTLKWLIGLSRNLTVNFVSSSYGGRATDKHITMDSNFLDFLEPGMHVMADRGFTVGDELKKLGVKLNMPDFKGRTRSQMTRRECENSEYISHARIHIERIIQRVRTYHILDSCAKLSMKDIYGQMLRSCAYLCNFQLPIIKPQTDSNLVDLPISKFPLFYDEE